MACQQLQDHSSQLIWPLAMLAGGWRDFLSSAIFSWHLSRTFLPTRDQRQHKCNFRVAPIPGTDQIQTYLVSASCWPHVPRSILQDPSSTHMMLLLFTNQPVSFLLPVVITVTGCWSKKLSNVLLSWLHSKFRGFSVFLPTPLLLHFKKSYIS